MVFFRNPLKVRAARRAEQRRVALENVRELGKLARDLSQTDPAGEITGRAADLYAFAIVKAGKFGASREEIRRAAGDESDPSNSRKR